MATARKEKIRGKGKTSFEEENRIKESTLPSRGKNIGSTKYIKSKLRRIVVHWFEKKKKKAKISEKKRGEGGVSVLIDA